MKEKWGLNLSYTLAENKLQVAVNKVNLSYTLAENKLQVAVNKVDLQHSYNKWILQWSKDIIMRF